MSSGPAQALQTPGLYVHLPFCLSRCAYCTFSSGLYNSELVNAYLDALKHELELRQVFTLDRTPSTLFIGGGTPSSLDLKQLEKLLYILQIPDAGGEATCELNPDSASPEKLNLLLNMGINRCSFGVQTFSADGLALLGRRHNAATAVKTVETALRLGFPDVSIDLISGWPGQEEKELVSDLRQAINLGIQHLSCYSLILEEGSALHAHWTEKGRPEPDDAEALRLWSVIEAILGEAGFEHYETSNFARPGHRCRHNVNTWKGKEYLGIGAAAHSHLEGRRFANMIDTTEYLYRIREDLLPEAFSETLPPLDKARECAVFWLRLFDGIDLAEFRDRTGNDFRELYTDILPDLMDRGMLEYANHGKNIRVTKWCQPVLDSVLVELV